MREQYWTDTLNSPGYNSSVSRSQGLTVADITAERNAPESKKFLAESARVELPAKELVQ
jgi:hypothetical protein